MSLQKLREQIEDQFPYLEESIEYAETKDEVMKQFHKQLCKFPCFVELRGLVYGLDLHEAVKQVDKFEECQDEFYSMILAKEFPDNKLEAYNRSQDVQVQYM